MVNLICIGMRKRKNGIIKNRPDQNQGGRVIEMISIYQKTLNKFGSKHQLRLLQEECAELIVAINKVSRYKKSRFYRDNLLEEIIDVETVLEQIKLLFSPEEKLNMRIKKLTRLEKILR